MDSLDEHRKHVLHLVNVKFNEIPDNRTLLRVTCEVGCDCHGWVPAYLQTVGVN